MRAPLAVAAVVLLLAAGVWAGLRESRRDLCFTGGEPVGAYAGMTLDEAESRAARDGDVLRVVGRDGKCADATADRRDDRINVYVEGSEVVQARRY